MPQSPLGTNEAEIHSLLKGRTKEDIKAIREAYQAHYERNLDADIHSELSGRDLFDAKMSLRGRAETAEEKLSRMNERYEYERGEGNTVGRFVMDRLSDKGALLDSNRQRANVYYKQAMSDGQLDQNEQARLSDLTSYANDDEGSYQNAKDSAADTAGTVAATAASAAVIVGTAGTATPFVATALMATGAGATARTVTSGLIEGRSYGIEDNFSDAGMGAVDGVATLKGVKAGTFAAQSALRTTATNTLRQQGLQVTERTVAHMSHQILSNSTGARMAFGAVEGGVDGAIGGALAEGGTTALRDDTWDQGIATGLERVVTSTAYGSITGSVGGSVGGGIVSRKSTHLADKMIDGLPLVNTGGRGGVSEWEFVKAGIPLERVEGMRQTLLARVDTGRIQHNLQKFGIKADREMIEAVKRYNFDSQGIFMNYTNYAAWNRLAQDKRTVSDAAYIVHEIAEIKMLQRVQQETGFDFIGRTYSEMSRAQKGHWKSTFEQVYHASHRQALEAEYDYIAQMVSNITGNRVRISRYVAAAADKERIEGQMHMFADGVQMKEHTHWTNWATQAKQPVDIGSKTRERLGFLRNETVSLTKIIEKVRTLRFD
jgi:hypothetical protein